MDNCKKPDAEQAEMINSFKNVKQKLLKTNKAICFSKVCGKNQLTPTCVKIKMEANNQQNKFIY